MLSRFSSWADENCMKTQSEIPVLIRIRQFNEDDVPVCAAKIACELERLEGRDLFFIDERNSMNVVRL